MLKKRTGIRFLKSMKLRVFIIIIIIAILPLFVMEYAVNEPMEKAMIESKMERLLSQCNILKNHIISEKYFDTSKSESVNAELALLSSMYDGRVLLINKNFVIIKDTYVMDENKITVSSDVIRCFKGENISKYNSKDNYIEIALSITNEAKSNIGVMLVTFSTKDVREAIAKVKNKIILAESILIILIVIAGVFISRFLAKPFTKIEASIDKISYGYFDEMLSLDGYSETEQIADAFNKMLIKMKQLDDSRQEFVSNVSHELKTPITSIKVLADSLLMQEEVPNEIYREFFNDIVAEVDRENNIITDLLTLVRLDKKNTVINISSVNINELVEVILKRLRPIAAKRNIEVVLESFRPIVGEIDEVKMTSAITNLVENAIKYNKVDGFVRVSLNADHKYFYIKVADSGIGIPQESQELIFERFYRVDKTRARQTGGTGLGLAITKNIILLHNGVIKVYSKEEEGTTFTVRIPLKYISDTKEPVQTILMDNA